MNDAIQLTEAQVWEKVYAQQDITSSMRQLESLSREKAEEVRQEIIEYCNALSD